MRSIRKRPAFDYCSHPDASQAGATLAVTDMTAWNPATYPLLLRFTQQGLNGGSGQSPEAHIKNPPHSQRLLASDAAKH